MKLTVLAGAKKGVALPIKKESFVIGRSKECSLRAGSEAISRRHCELLVTNGVVTIRDLGSRNGTYVNDEKIEDVQALADGDRLRVGPLEFRFEAATKPEPVQQPAVASNADPSPAPPHEGPRSSGLEESISDWLLGNATGADAPAVGETISLGIDDTRQILRDAAAAEDGSDNAAPEDQSASEGEEAERPTKGKKEPGKLPFRPTTPQAKDSREAAAQVLRDMARRR